MFKKIAYSLMIVLVLLGSYGCTTDVTEEPVVETKEVIKTVEVEKEVTVVETVEVEVEKVVEKEAEPFDSKVAFVLPGLINDGSFNTVVYNSFTAAADVLGTEFDYVENYASPADAAKPIRDYASEGYDVVWAHGGQYPNTVLQIAPDFPNTTFVTLAGPGLELPDNVWISGNEQEDGFFLTGALAGLMTKTNKLGFVGGMELPIYKAGAKSFEEGALYVNPDVEVYTAFTGDFNDPTAAKEAAIGQIELGADIIGHALNLGAYGLFEAARTGEDVKIIGKDTDQFMIAPDVVLASLIFDYEDVILTILRKVEEGDKGGYLPMNLASGSLYLSPYYGQVPEEVAARVSEIEQMLVDGEIDYTTQGDLTE